MPLTGHTVTIERSTDGGSWTSLATGLAPTSQPYLDNHATIQHDPATGTRTERRYRVSLVRTSDSATVSQLVTDAVVTYDAECEP
jgi:hypothetical protein